MEPVKAEGTVIVANYRTVATLKGTGILSD